MILFNAKLQWRNKKTALPTRNRECVYLKYSAWSLKNRSHGNWDTKVLYMLLKTETKTSFKFSHNSVCFVQDRESYDTPSTSQTLCAQKCMISNQMKGCKKWVHEERWLQRLRTVIRSQHSRCPPSQGSGSQEERSLWPTQLSVLSDELLTWIFQITSQI